MHSPLSTLLGQLAGLWLVVVILAAGCFGVFWPLMAFSMMRNIKGIHRELRQLNETLGSKMTITKGGPLGLS